MAKVTVRYLKNGKVVSMDKRYADVLVKLNRVAYSNVPLATGFKQAAFKDSIVEKQVSEDFTESETKQDKWGTEPLVKAKRPYKRKNAENDSESDK